jgi:pyridoxal 5'-phosphate synthase pdxT subunit
MLNITPLSAPFHAIFIRAPVVEEIYEGEVEVVGKLQVHSEIEEKELIVAVRRGNIFGTAFHPELTGDNRLHEWWVKEVVIPAWNEKNNIK